MIFLNLLDCGREIIFRYQNNGFKSETYIRNWNNTLFLFSVYLLTCTFVFFVNSLVPAKSPRQYLKGQFKHPLTLSGFGKFLNGKCKDNKSANSFPSGHVAEILCIGLAYMASKEYSIGIIVIICSFLIGLATLFLRYHYFCDILMAIIIAFLGFLVNYCFGYRKYKNKNNYKDDINQKVKFVHNLPERKKELEISEDFYNNLKGTL